MVFLLIPCGSPQNAPASISKTAIKKSFDMLLYLCHRDKHCPTLPFIFKNSISKQQLYPTKCPTAREQIIRQFAQTGQAIHLLDHGSFGTPSANSSNFNVASPRKTRVWSMRLDRSLARVLPPMVQTLPMSDVCVWCLEALVYLWAVVRTCNQFKSVK